MMTALVPAAPTTAALPALSTVTTEGSEEDQEPDCVELNGYTVADRVNSEPGRTLTESRSSFTLSAATKSCRRAKTSTLQYSVTPPAVTDTVAVPSPTARTTPSEVTTATEESEVLKIISPS